jgi:hypothetical protein
MGRGADGNRMFHALTYAVRSGVLKEPCAPRREAQPGARAERSVMRAPWGAGD